MDDTTGARRQPHQVEDLGPRPRAEVGAAEALHTPQSPSLCRFDTSPHVCFLPLHKAGGLARQIPTYPREPRGPISQPLLQPYLAKGGPKAQMRRRFIDVCVHARRDTVGTDGQTLAQQVQASLRCQGECRADTRYRRAQRVSRTALNTARQGWAPLPLRLRALSPPRIATSSACRLVSSSAVCSCSSASSRSRSVSACLALDADRRELRLQALALRLHLGNLVLELLDLPLRRQLLVLILLLGRALLAERRAPARQRFLEAIRGYARARPVRGGAWRPPRPGAAASTAGSAAPRRLRTASGVGSAVERRGWPARRSAVADETRLR